MRWSAGRSRRVGMFFFEAEGGRRDDLVTGVQTCALPIYAFRTAPAWRPARHAGAVRKASCQGVSLRVSARAGRTDCGRPRAEKRRAGKKVRTRMGPEH